MTAGAVSIVALLISSSCPVLGPLMVALVIGVLVANLPRCGWVAASSAPRIDRFLLRTGVVLLGLKVSLADIAALGPIGVLVVVGTVGATYVATHAAGRALGLDLKFVTLVAAGFSICGAAAIVAVETSIRAKARDVATAVALVTVFGSMMIAVVPLLGDALALSQRQTAVWAGASIHEVAQVIAAASLISGAAVATATSVKLARVVLLLPVQMFSARLCREDPRRSGPALPIFLVGFAIAVALRTSGSVPAIALQVASDLTTLLLGAAMFGLGTTIVAHQLWPVPWRALALATIASAVAAGTSLALVTMLI